MKWATIDFAEYRVSIETREQLGGVLGGGTGINM